MLNLTELFSNFEKSILSFADANNLAVMHPNSQNGVSVDSENICFLCSGKDYTIYLISHDEINLFQNYFSLTEQSINKINEIRKFIYGFYSKPDDRKQNCLKVKYQKENNQKENSIEFSIFGDFLPSLRVRLTEKDISITYGYGYSVSVTYLSEDTFEQKFNEVLCLVPQHILTMLGFDGCDENSEEVITFMKKSVNDLLIDHFEKFGFNYIHKDALILQACAESSISIDDLLEQNKDVKEPDTTIRIPNTMIDLLPKIIKNIFPDNDVEKKFKQLINLMSFYTDLMSQENDSLIIFKKYEKHELSPSAILNSAYCHLSLFGGECLITLGSQLKPNDHLSIIYEDHIDEKSENGYQYQFMSSLNNKEYSTTGKSNRYFTNDIDFIYNIVLTQIRELIADTINTNPDAITSRDLEVFKMATI